MLLMDPKLLFGGLLLALALDACFGDPRRLWGRVPHPVVLMGRAIARLEARWLDLATPAVVQARRGDCQFAGDRRERAGRSRGAGAVHPPAARLAAARSRHEHADRGARPLRPRRRGRRRSGARSRRGAAAVAHIVGRDPASGCAWRSPRRHRDRTAENFADGVVAPLFWGVLLGLPGMAAYKAINTLDSMIGHRSPRYVHFGRFAARLDDVANWLPARLSALLILAAALFLPGATPAAGWRALWRDASRHRSPNAGWPEAAIAGALGLSLAGPRRYAGELVDDAWMGDGRAAATVTDIRRALRLLVSAWSRCCPADRAGGVRALDLKRLSSARARAGLRGRRALRDGRPGHRGGLDLLLEGEAGGRARLQAGKKGVAKAIGGEQAVDVAAHDPAVGGQRRPRGGPRDPTSAARAPGRSCAPHASRSRGSARRSRSRGRGPRCSCLSPVSTVSMIEQPEAVGGARRPLDAGGSAMRRPSIWKPPQIPSTAPPRRTCAARSTSQPCARRSARSASVALEPGRNHEIGIAGQRRAGGTICTCTSGSASAGRDRRSSRSARAEGRRS